MTNNGNKNQSENITYDENATISGNITNDKNEALSESTIKNGYVSYGNTTININTTSSATPTNNSGRTPKGKCKTKSPTKSATVNPPSLCGGKYRTQVLRQEALK